MDYVRSLLCYECIMQSRMINQDDILAQTVLGCGEQLFSAIKAGLPGHFHL